MAKNQVKYIQEYNKENYEIIRVALSRKYDAPLIEKINQQPSKSGYIKELIQKDLKSN